MMPVRTGKFLTREGLEAEVFRLRDQPRPVKLEGIASLVGVSTHTVWRITQGIRPRSLGTRDHG